MTDQKPGAKDIVILAAIIAVAAAIRIYCFHGFASLDDAEYARFANRIVHGDFTPSGYTGPAVFPLRIGIIFPAALSFRLLGVSQFSLAAFPLVMSILSLVLAYLCATLLFGRREGLIAAALWAVLPIEASDATTLFPDLPAAFWGSLGIILILAASDPGRRRREGVFAVGLLAGLSFGFSWLTKESVAYLAPFCLVLLYLTLKGGQKKNVYLWAGVAAGSFAVLLSEAVVYHHMSGDWLFRFHEIDRNYRQWQNGFFTEGSHWGWPAGTSYHKALVKRLFMTGPEMIFLNPQFLYLPVFGIMASLYAAYWKDKRFLVPSLWFISLVLMYNFSSSSASRYAPLALFDRYLYPVLLPSMILTAGFIGRTLFRPAEGLEDATRRERFFWGAVIASLLVLIGGYQTFRNFRDIRTTRAWIKETRAVSALLNPADPLYTDSMGIKELEFFWRYPNRTALTDFEGVKAGDIPQGSYVLLIPKHTDWIARNAGMWLSRNPVYKKPEFLDKVPPDWKTVWRDDDSGLYRVGR